MNLADKREILKSKQAELKTKVDQAKELETKVKTTIDDATLAQLKGKAEEIVKVVKILNEEINSITNEIEQEEKSLNDLAWEAKRQKEEAMKGGKNVDYLKSKQALTDFAKILQKTGGRDALKDAWKEHLNTKGITNPEVFLPQAIIDSINDALGTPGSIFSTFRYTGLTMLKTALNTNINTDTSRAQGHKRGTTKKEQEITVEPKEIRAQFIYKYITLDKELLRETQDTGAVIRYVMEELPRRIIAEIERSAMIGDGRDITADDHIHSYEAIARDTSDVWVTVNESTDDLLHDLIHMDATISADGFRYLLVSRKTLANIRLTSNNGGLVFPLGSSISDALGYSRIFTADFMELEDAPIAIEYVGDAYRTVGDNTINSFENFILAQNKNEYLMEIYSGGGITVPYSAAVLINGSSGPDGPDEPDEPDED